MASLSQPEDGPQDTREVIAQRTHAVEALRLRLLGASAIYTTFMGGLTLTAVTRGRVIASLPLTSMHLNSSGTLHGAVSATIIDFVTGLAICSWDLRPTTGASVDMHISYLSTAGEGEVVEVESTAERVGASLAYVTIRISKVDKDGARKLVTLGQHTKYVQKRTATARSDASPSITTPQQQQQ